MSLCASPKVLLAPRYHQNSVHRMSPLPLPSSRRWEAPGPTVQWQCPYRPLGQSLICLYHWCSLPGGLHSLPPAPLARPRGLPWCLAAVFRCNKGLGEVTAFPIPSQPRGLPSGPCTPASTSWKGASRDGLGSVGCPWATPGSFLVTLWVVRSSCPMAGAEHGRGLPQPSLSSWGLAHASPGSLPLCFHHARWPVLMVFLWML